ncbi:hypothetical protein D3C80_2002120 [compost metagenome]
MKGAAGLMVLSGRGTPVVRYSFLDWPFHFSSARLNSFRLGFIGGKTLSLRADNRRFRPEADIGQRACAPN